MFAGLDLPYFVSADSRSWCLLLYTAHNFFIMSSYVPELYLKEFSKAQAEGGAPPGRVYVCPGQVLRGTQIRVHSQPTVSRTFQRV